MLTALEIELLQKDKRESFEKMVKIMQSANYADKQDALNEFATESFRNTADQDYIAARMSYRAGLIEPFLWSGLHAIEKYLKAILLFNSLKAKKYGHDIEKLFGAVKEIERLDLRLPQSVDSFIKYLNEYGKNRYFEEAAYLPEYALDSLDETVWYIRRYCYYMKEYENEYYRNTRKISPLEQELNPKRYNISGLLEKIVKEESAAYPYLIWNNCFYGKEEQECDRSSIRNTQRKFSAINPPLAFFGKEAFDILVDYVDFSASTKNYYK